MLSNTLKLGIALILTVVISTWVISGLIKEKRELSNTIESIKTYHSQTKTNTNKVVESALKSPKATSQMERIAEKKPELLEKRMNKGFGELAQDIQETSK